MKVLDLLVALLLISPALAAQSREHSAAPAQPPATGSITGRVTLGDSRLPARMATVILLPAGSTDAGDEKSTAGSVQAQAGLDGTFVLPSVLPGSYFLFATKLGYTLPIPDSGCLDDYDKARQDIKSAIAATVPTVTVTANRISTADFVLNKGAVISGTVRFDDGEPDSEAVVSLLRKDKSGKWTACQIEGFASTTDDQGNFRLAGVPAGDYLLKTTLALDGDGVHNPGTGLTGNPNYRWDIYFGDGVRPRDARTIQLKDGEESNGILLRIPLSRFHSISGIVLNRETGAPIRSAHLELHNLDDDSICTQTSVNNVGQFHFPYVAEGEYTLKVINASDSVPEGRSAKFQTPNAYEDASQALILHNEMNGVTIQVRSKPAAASTAPSN